MALKISEKNFKNLLKQKKITLGELGLKESENKRNNQDRLSDAIEKIKVLNEKDKICLNEDKSKCLILLEDVIMISTNISLRLGAKQMHTYKQLWKDRIKNLASDNFLQQWGDISDRQVKIEFLYEIPTKKYMDYDGRIGAFKSALDGLVDAEIIKDDKENFVPIVLGKQQKSKDKKYRLYIIISIEKDFEKYYSEQFNNLLSK